MTALRQRARARAARFAVAWCLCGAWGLPSGAQVSDSVRRDLAQGRFWKASRALEAELAPLGSARLQDRMVLAEARAGWGDHAGVVAALLAGGADTLDAAPDFWRRLGLAHEASGDARAAASAFARFVDRAPAGGPAALAGRSRLARALARAGRPAPAREAALALARRSEPLGDWTALEVARILAGVGDADGARRMAAAIADPAVARRAWRLEADAWAQAGDTGLALAALTGARNAPSSGRPRLERFDLEWRFRLALGDSLGAVRAMEDLLARSSSGPLALAAARAHWRVARDSGPEALVRVASALGRGSEHGRAVVAWRLAVERGARLDARQRMARAAALRGAGELALAVEEYRRLAAPASEAGVAAPALRAWAEVRRRQGRLDDAAILRDRLVERYPASAEALDAVFFLGDDLHDQGRLDDAEVEYRRVVAMSEGADRAGLARMRWGQIHLTRGEPQAAMEVFGAYLAAFPDGRRWEEASYWAAHAARLVGDAAGAEAWLARIREESPLSYYAFVAAERDGARRAPPSSRGVAPEPAWLPDALGTLGLLEDAGLAEGADVHVAAMRAMAAASADAALRLAVALNEAGRALDGIRAGLALRRAGRPWDRTLLEVVYPFPHRELVTARSRELGLDPFLVAGLMRQESAFSPTIVSPAGAVGLMQVMPATGRQIANRIGPEGFRRDFLEAAELNVRMGTHFLAELLDRYDGETTLALSAYNAGPTRANRWRSFQEAEDPLRFTERIPFAETREYVKIVTRNRSLYRWLYDRDAGDGG